MDRVRDAANDVHNTLGRIGAATLLAASGAVALVVADEQPAHAAGEKATIGMPFSGKWAYSGLTTAEDLETMKPRIPRVMTPILATGPWMYMGLPERR